MIPIKDTVPRIGFPLVTWALIILNGTVFLFELSLPREVLEQIFYLFGLVPARFTYPKEALTYLPFLTNLFLHGGWLHILGNMWFLHLFGDNVEDRMGHLRFLIFYLLSGVMSNVINFIANIHSSLPEIGASGAISGVMGAYLIMFPKARIITLIPVLFFPLFVELSAFFYIGFWFILQVFSGTLSIGAPEGGGGVAWWAHIGGFVTGIVLLPFFRRKRFRRQGYPDEAYRYIDH